MAAVQKPKNSDDLFAIQDEEEIKPKKNSFLHSLINNFTNAAMSLVISIDSSARLKFSIVLLILC